MIAVLIMAGSSCKKDDSRGPEIPRDPGSFTAIVEGKQVDFPGHSAIYDTKGHSIFITAKDYDYELEAGFFTDSVQPLKNYIFETNGFNSAIMYKSGTIHVTSNNDPGAGGSISITKLDIANKKLSGTMSMTYVANNRTETLTLTKGIFTDIPLTLDTVDLINNQFDCSVTGVNTTQWHDIYNYPYIECISPGNKKELNLTIHTLATNQHILEFKIPLSFAPGSYTVYPNEPPNSYCGSDKIAVSYGNSSTYKFLPTSGSFDILESDIPNKKFKAKFNILFSNTANPSETIRFGNGVISLVYWKDM